MTCAVDFIVERSEDVLMVSNAALRYQPTSLSADEIGEMVFNASLENLNDEQRQAAIEAREQAQAQSIGQNNQNANTGIAGLVGGQNNMRMPGSPPGGRQRSGAGQGAGGRARTAVVVRNLWFITGGKFGVVQVQTGVSNGSFTEILSMEELEGREVILRERI
jgi:hypothetical protein